MGTQPPPHQGGGALSPIFGPFLLWLNGCMHQDATWYGGRPRPKRHCVRCGPSYPIKTGHTHPHPTFGPSLLWPNGWMDEDAAWYGNRPWPMPRGVRRGSQLPRKGHSSPRLFGPCLLWPNGCMDQDVTWYGGRPKLRPRRHCVRWDPAPPEKRHSPPSNIWPMSVVAKRLDGSRCHLVRR